jgi:hypothetical protein
MTTTTCPVTVTFLRVPIVPLAFPSAEDWKRYLELWREGNRNGEIPLPIEGTDYELEGT